MSNVIRAQHQPASDTTPICPQEGNTMTRSETTITNMLGAICGDEEDRKALEHEQQKPRKMSKFKAKLGTFGSLASLKAAMEKKETDKRVKRRQAKVESFNRASKRARQRHLNSCIVCGAGRVSYSRKAQKRAQEEGRVLPQPERMDAVVTFKLANAEHSAQMAGKVCPSHQEGDAWRGNLGTVEDIKPTPKPLERVKVDGKLSPIYSLAHAQRELALVEGEERRSKLKETIRQRMLDAPNALQRVPWAATLVKLEGRNITAQTVASVTGYSLSTVRKALRKLEGSTLTVIGASKGSKTYAFPVAG